MADVDLILSELRRIEEKINLLPNQSRQLAPEIIDTKEICKRLNISEPTLITFRKRKKFPCFRVGNSIRYNWITVIEFLEEQKS